MFAVREQRTLFLDNQAVLIHTVFFPLERDPTMKPQDILIILKIQSLNDKAMDAPSSWPQRLLAEETGLSLSEVNAACRRLEEVGLLTPERRKVVPPCLNFSSTVLNMFFLLQWEDHLEVCRQGAPLILCEMIF